MYWITNNDTIIFDPKYNNKLNGNFISGYAKLIFSDYKLSQQCNIPNVKYLKLNCNNSYIIDSLPNSIVELGLERRYCFYNTKNF